MRSSFRFPLTLPVLFAILLLAWTFPQPMTAQQAGTTSSSIRFQIEKIRLGVNGQCKLGVWVPVRLTLTQSPPENSILAMTLPDTDGVETIFRDEQPTLRIIDGKTILETVVKLGRKRGTLTAKLYSAGESSTPFASQTIPIADACNTIESLRELYVAVGDPLDITSGATIGGKAEFDQPATTTLLSPHLLYSNQLAYESVDGLILEASTLETESLDIRIQTALVEWVRNGGRLAITSEKLQMFAAANPTLAELIAADFNPVRRMQSTSNLERIVKAESPVSQRRDRPFMTVLRNFPGEVLVRDGEAPVILRQSPGYGKIILIMTNIAKAPFSNWSERRQLTGYIVSLLNLGEKTGMKQQFRLSRYGYVDISGQLRAALDKFRQVSIVNFTLVAAIALVFIALIGPGDYFFLKRVIGRMEWTWVTFLSIVVLVSALTVVIFKVTKPNRLLCRQIEVIDVDMATRAVRGSLWSHIYSPETKRYDLSWKNTGDPQILPTGKIGSWQGFPGEALGGMGNPTTPTGTSTDYSIAVGPFENSKANLSAVPINVAATKGFFMQWTGSTSKELKTSLKISRGSLSGRVHNPLDCELENIFVIYENSAFLLKSKLGPNDSFDIAADTVEKGVADYLNRRRLKEMGTEATPWIVTDTDLKRIVEVMMFYDKAGGQGYVKLLQRYQPKIDLSPSLDKTRAVLVGRTPKPANTICIEGTPLSQQYEESWTYYRIMLPVQLRTPNVD